MRSLRTLLMVSLRRTRACAPGLLLLVSLVAGCDGGPDEPGSLVTPSTAAQAASILPIVFEQKPPPPPLSVGQVPPVLELNLYVLDLQAAVVLGKAFFWDQQAGSDGTACATCHYQAGADNRYLNQLAPSLNHTNLAKAGVYDKTRTGRGAPNYTLRRGDFPFHVLLDPKNRDSKVVFSSDDVVSSSGVFARHFSAVADATTSLDRCELVLDPRFRVGGLATRRVVPRNSPSVINAVFNERNFWDGRANNFFNGVSPFGPRDTAARIQRWTGTALQPEVMRLQNGSLASQAVGPTLSDFEMSCGGRVFADVGRKLLSRRALATQKVAVDDSALAPYRHSSGLGLADSYATLIQRAFRPEWWSAPASATSGTPQMEQNFSLFWGLAIQAYESTLVSDDTPFDRYLRGDATALTAAQVRGLTVFTGQGQCIGCHAGPALTTAARTVRELNPLQRMPLATQQIALYDDGFYNIGVRPSEEDRGLGGTDPFGNPLAFAPQWLEQVRSGRAPVDPIRVNPDLFEVRAALPSNPTAAMLQLAYSGDRVAVDGAFKVPGLRNVELTGPYFHNGGEATLDDVVLFYNRGGNRRLLTTTTDTSRFGAFPTNLAALAPLGLTDAQRADLVAFLKGLTDERVRWEKAPFDHPALTLPHGHKTAASSTLGSSYATDIGLTLPEVGSAGRAARNLPALAPFDTQLR